MPCDYNAGTETKGVFWENKINNKVSLRGHFYSLKIGPPLRVSVLSYFKIPMIEYILFGGLCLS